MTVAYETDFAQWAAFQAALLKAGKFHELDIPNLIEEVESMGRSEHRELKNRMIQLLMHLLKWQFQPERQGSSWQVSIIKQREAIAVLLDESPSVKTHFADDAWVNTVWASAVRLAAAETNLPKNTFPAEPVWTMVQVLEEEFYP